MPAALDDVEQIDCCKLLGVIFQSNFKMDSYVNYLLSQCAQRMYILKLLRHQSVSSQQIITVAYALIQRFSTFVTLWTPQKFQARVADPTAQGALASTFRTPGWARTCLIKIAYPNDLNSTKC